MVTSFKELIKYARDNVEMSSFACWKLGYKHLPQMKLDMQTQVQLYYAYIYYMCVYIG